MAGADQQPQPFGEMKRGYQAVVTLAGIVAFPVVLCTTRFGTWGNRYLGFTAVAGFFWPYLFVAFWGPDPRAYALGMFWLLSLGLLVIHRIRGGQLRRRGYRCHSRYWGRSWFETDQSPGNSRFARTATSLLVLVAGLIWTHWNPPLGMLFVFGAIAKWVSEAAVFQEVEARLRQMDDARIENEYYTALYRQRHGLD